MKFLRPYYALLFACFLVLSTLSCNDEPVEIATIVNTDNDGIEESIDNCPTIANPNQEDDDNDGIGNVCENNSVDPNAPLARCENGFADIYPCNDYDLMAFVPINYLGGAGSDGNDCWDG